MEMFFSYKTYLTCAALIALGAGCSLSSEGLTSVGDYEDDTVDPNDEPNREITESDTPSPVRIGIAETQKVDAREADAQTGEPQKADAQSQPLTDANRPDVKPLPSSLIIRATADTYARASGLDETFMFVNNDNSNFGDQTVMQIKHRPGPDEGHFWREAFIAFSVPSVAKVKRAKVVLTVATRYGPMDTATLEIRALDNLWTESNLVWANRPSAGTLLGNVKVLPGQKVEVQVDVTAYVAARLDAGTRSIAFGLVQNATTAYQNNSHIEVDAREAGATGPQLVLEF